MTMHVRGVRSSNARRVCFRHHPTRRTQAPLRLRAASLPLPGDLFALDVDGEASADPGHPRRWVLTSTAGRRPIVPRWLAGSLTLASPLPLHRRFYFETVVVKRKPKLLCQGQLFSLELEPEGPYPKLSEPFVKSNPLLVDALDDVRRMQKNGEMDDPAALVARLRPTLQPSLLVKLDSLSELTERLRVDPRMWTDGTGPNDAPLTVDEQALLTAGELLALSEGFRGVALLQVALLNSGSRLPLLRPFVFPLLKMLHEDGKRVVMLPSKVEGARSLVVSAKRQPFVAWARYLAGLGCQASLVADSDFYKVLIGRMMGYRLENVEHHVLETTGKGVDARVRAAVEAELAGLSATPPSLPWR